MVRWRTDFPPYRRNQTRVDPPWSGDERFRLRIEQAGAPQVECETGACASHDAGAGGDPGRRRFTAEALARSFQPQTEPLIRYLAYLDAIYVLDCPDPTPAARQFWMMGG